mmetsp:Transcript_16213/g.32623  ORF Transcript_16213/g.32623 Transcript_16213/m.32623 type:complete len:167 (+) Transcript_16213:159-659(+)
MENRFAVRVRSSAQPETLALMRRLARAQSVTRTNINAKMAAVYQRMNAVVSAVLTVLVQNGKGLGVPSAAWRMRAQERLITLTSPPNAARKADAMNELTAVLDGFVHQRRAAATGLAMVAFLLVVVAYLLLALSIIVVVAYRERIFTQMVVCFLSQVLMSPIAMTF